MKSTGTDKIGSQNKMIAEFIGKTIVFENGKHYEVKDHLWKPFMPQYHTSLDWLHPVIQKIGQLGSDLEKKSKIGWYMFYLSHPEPSICADISVIYEWVCKAIEWTNQNKTT